VQRIKYFCDKCGEETKEAFGHDWFVLDDATNIPHLELLPPGHRCISAELCFPCYLKELEYRVEQMRKTVKEK
jgi:hypothetical protein